MNVQVTVMESPFVSATSLNVCLASIPEAATVVLLNRPDSPILCVLPLVIVKVFANSILVVAVLVPFVHVVLVASALIRPVVVLVSFPSQTCISLFAFEAPVA